jgi:hypothetical protein
MGDCPLRAFSIRGFQYHEKHRYAIRGQILKPMTRAEPSPGLPGNVTLMIKIYIKEFWCQLNIKMAIIIPFTVL